MENLGSRSLIKKNIWNLKSFNHLVTKVSDKLMIELENIHDLKSILNTFEKLMYDFQFSEYEYFNY